MERNKIKKFILPALGLVIFFSIIFGLPAYSFLAAATASDSDLTFDPGGTLSDVTDLGNRDPASITYDVVNYALLFLGLITVVMIIISGFMWIFAAGNEEKIKKAQEILKGAVIGLLVIMISYGAAQYVFDKLVEITTGAVPTTTSSTETEETGVIIPED
ncbi:MAG: hypothetical protein WC752_00555 [Patescibacteria group bacterium]|jgi:uncharacterized BrkB/YihY/UPF0761 family membrane protein